MDASHPGYHTPLMKQYLALKIEAGPDAILFFRMGDFYELFGDDAVRAAPILGVTLTSRDKNAKDPVPMAGLPYHSAQGYIQKVLNAGFKLAIAEQILPPGMTVDQIKGIVERKIVRVFTPAVQFDMGADTQNSNRYLATILPHLGTTHSSDLFILSCLDPATGTVIISEPSPIKFLQSAPLFSSIKHFLNISAKIPAEFLQSLDSILCEDVPPNLIADQQVDAFLTDQYQKAVLHPLLLHPAAKKGLATLIQYTLKSQGVSILRHLTEPRPLIETTRLQLGPNTASHLDLSDLFDLINLTATSTGARYLRNLIQSPYRDLSSLKAAQDAVSILATESLAATRMNQELKNVYDLERILGRIVTQLASPRDLAALGKSLDAAFGVCSILKTNDSSVLLSIKNRFDDAQTELQTLTDRMMRTLKSEAPLHTRDGGIFEMGTDPDLDRLITLSTHGERFLVELETRERERTDIQSLKVKFNRVFGYFIEVTSANLGKVPSDYQRKQTMVGGERFFTEELKKFEEEILTASIKQKALEQELFHKLIQDLLAQAQPLKSLSDAIAELDALLSLSHLAHRSGWCMPVIDDGLSLQIEGGRHPVVDLALRGKYVPNDIVFDDTDARTLIVTGPNMGGKSTLMRMLAQIVLLGQMGAPVPARHARFGVFHEIFTRIGAHDAIAKGQSTFMVEMVELAYILNHATPRSLVILDEIGRGTSTFDGMSVASSALSYLHEKSRPRMIFATHYHELTDLEQRHAGIKNAHMMVAESPKLTFLYEIAPGRSSKSFGIQVAELAGLPKAVIKGAWEVLKDLENHTSHKPPSQLSLFEPPQQSSEVEIVLAGLNIDELRPVDAIKVLSDLQGKLINK